MQATESNITEIDNQTFKINQSMKQLDNQLFKMESIPLKQEESKIEKRDNTIPIMLKCYICEDYCDQAVQIICCYENFCDKHIRDEIIKNFTCPNCKVSATLRDIVPNKRMRENITWFKGLISDNNQESHEPLKINDFIKDVPNALEIQNEKENTIMKKLDIEKIITTEMSIEEKMELYNSKNETKTETIVEDKLTEKKAADKLIPTQQLPTGMPFNDPRMFMGGFDPRMFYGMYPGAPNFPMFPPIIQPTDDKMKKSKSSSSSDSEDKTKKKKKRRHRSRSYTRSHDNRKKKDRDRDRKDRDRSRDRKDRDYDRHKKKKYK